MTASAPSTMRRDIASAYLAAATKIGSWVIVSAIIYRGAGPITFGLVSLARATLSVLNYTTLGLAPAMMTLLAAAQRAEASRTSFPTAGNSLDYSGPRVVNYSPRHVIFFNGMIAGACAFLIAMAIIFFYGDNISVLLRMPSRGDAVALYDFVIAYGFGVAFRLMSDVPGSVLQTQGRIALDNFLLACADVIWVLLLVGTKGTAPLVGVMYALSSAMLLAGRLLVAALHIGLTRRQPPIVWNVIRELLVFGTGVTIAQLADYLYAPVDFVLINRLLDPVLTAVYSPAVQIDAGLLVLVGGVASVLLPKTALAHASGNVALIRKYYLRGTLVTAGLLATAGIFVWLLSPWIFRLWLHDPMTATQVILPLVLVHTVVGGSSAVGRSVLLGMGKVKPFTIAVLCAGVANVILSYCFVRFAGLGLKGIILGTIVVVVARCAIWQPWYVLQTLKAAGASPMVFRPENAQTTC